MFTKQESWKKVQHMDVPGIAFDSLDSLPGELKVWMAKYDVEIKPNVRT